MKLTLCVFYCWYQSDFLFSSHSNEWMYVVGWISVEEWRRICKKEVPISFGQKTWIVHNFGRKCWFLFERLAKKSSFPYTLISNSLFISFYIAWCCGYFVCSTSRVYHIRWCYHVARCVWAACFYVHCTCLPLNSKQFH